jgi:glycosyltransferase involved in cell wall biosynthesis
MMTNPLVSVVIPTKNSERYLASAIESVIRTDYTPMEIIVVDGQSVDKTAEIARSFEVVRYIRQHNHGLSNAYNIGIDAARGELIAFQASDDLWTRDKLSTQVNYMLNHPEIQYTIARVKFFLEPGIPSPPGFRQELLEGDHVGRILETLVVRKSLFEVVGKFDPDITISMDVDWYARANDNDIPMAVLPQVLLYRRVHDSNHSLNVSVNNQNFNTEMLKILKRSVKRKQHHKTER